MIMVHGRGAGPGDILSLRAGSRSSQRCLHGAHRRRWNVVSASRLFRRASRTSRRQLRTSRDRVACRRSSRTRFRSHKILLLGFSQGACLSSEFTIRHPRRYGGVLVLSGGLIGVPGTTWDDVTANLDRTPVLSWLQRCRSHIPKERVIESEAVFQTARRSNKRILYPGIGPPRETRTRSATCST